MGARDERCNPEPGMCACFDHYVVVVASEPIPGVPSHRLYGLCQSYEDGYAELTRAGIVKDGHLTEGWTHAVVLPLRQLETILKESP